MQIKVIENENEIYIREKLLGQGAFGKAYLVRHKDTGEQLVIKEMSIQHMSTKERDETIKEAQILRSLKHPNIVNFKEFYITKNNKLKIVMEFAECGDLAKAIAQRKPKKEFFNETQILDWFTQICLAIKHVHDRKILHRDIKGQNIFIAKNNSLKLGDFGIARVLNQTHEKARTVVGTPYYLSPEIIQNKPYSFKSDIWSIGAVLYELCQLQPPFQANSLQMLALKIVKGSYTPIEARYSKQLKSLVSQMLTLDPNKRPNIQQILQKPVIQERIKKFLSETKRVTEFSHTILHNQKVQIFANKLVHIQSGKQANQNANKSTQKLQQERQKLKDQQIKMEAILKRKQEEKKRQELRKQNQIRIKEEQKKKRIIYEQQKKQQMQRDYEERLRAAEMQKQRKIQQDKLYQKQMQFAELHRQKQELEQRKRKQQEQARRQRERNERDKKQMNYNDFARQQYFENLEIRKRAEERARRQQQGYYEQPAPLQEPPAIKNYHYSEQDRPKSKQEVRPASVEKKPNFSDLYNKPSKKEPQPTEQELINAFCNPNFNKKAQPKKPVGQPQVIPKKQPEIPRQKEKAQSSQNSNKKAEDMRQQIRKDRQNFLKGNKQPQEKQEIQTSSQEPVGKWGKRRSSSKSKAQNSPDHESPRFRQASEQPKDGETEQTEQEQANNEKFDQLIRDSENLFLQVHNPQEFNQYIGELEDIIQGVKKCVDLLPEIPVQNQILFRDDDDDVFQLSLTAEPQKKQEDMDVEGADLDYFSNYSKLETLRMQLEEALGLENFIQLYRCIERQVGQQGLEGFNIDDAIKEVGPGIDSKVARKNATLLLTLVALEDKMSYT